MSEHSGETTDYTGRSQESRKGNKVLNSLRAGLAALAITGGAFGVSHNSDKITEEIHDTAHRLSNGPLDGPVTTEQSRKIKEENIRYEAKKDEEKAKPDKGNKIIEAFGKK